MRETNHIIHLLDDYLDEALPATTTEAVAQHLDQCPACRAALAEREALQRRLRNLPSRIAPPRDLWPALASRLATVELSVPVPPNRTRAPLARATTRRRVGVKRGLFAVCVLVGVGLVVLLWRQGSPEAWEVEALAGTPWVGGTPLAQAGTLHVGEWVETDAASRAKVAIGAIGEVEVAPQTRLQLQRAVAQDHRLGLQQGRIHAQTWVPPRQFFIETPAGLAVDLGCEFTLEVDSAGVSLLHVLSGFVGFAYGDRESLVPAGWMAWARPGYLPGTPFSETASEALRAALLRFDFEQGGAEAVSDIVAEARAADALTLWELIWRVDEGVRGPLYDQLVALVDAPEGVSRAGVLAREEAMIKAWRTHFGVDVMYWLSYKKKKKRR